MTAIPVRRRRLKTAPPRGHAELAALYRQAALVAALAYRKTYVRLPDPGDPPGVEALVQASRALLEGGELPSLAALPPVEVGVCPPGPLLPHLVLREPTAQGASQEYVDPNVFAALSRWHQQPAVVAGGSAAAVETFLSRYPWPRRRSDPGEPLSDELLLGTPLLASGDGPFVAALAIGPEAVEAHAG